MQRNSIVRVSSRRAEIQATAFVTPTVQPGQLFIPMHYPEVNQLTFPAFDSYSRQPSYKACAVKIEPA
jgi:anaerobic selenocysteine-containing dehydrogenase